MIDWFIIDDALQLNGTRRVVMLYITYANLDSHTIALEFSALNRNGMPYTYGLSDSIMNI